MRPDSNLVHAAPGAKLLLQKMTQSSAMLPTDDWQPVILARDIYEAASLRDATHRGTQIFLIDTPPSVMHPIVPAPFWERRGFTIARDTAV